MLKCSKCPAQEDVWIKLLCSARHGRSAHHQRRLLRGDLLVEYSRVAHEYEYYEYEYNFLRIFKIRIHPVSIIHIYEYYSVPNSTSATAPICYQDYLCGTDIRKYLDHEYHTLVLIEI